MAFEGMSTKDDSKFPPLRILLCGTRQGADLHSVMGKLKMRDIFAEEFDFSEKPFKNDYLSVIHSFRSYDEALVEQKIPLAVELTIMLEKTEFFGTLKVGIVLKGIPRVTSGTLECFAPTVCRKLNHIS